VLELSLFSERPATSEWGGVPENVPARRLATS